MQEPDQVGVSWAGFVLRVREAHMIRGGFRKQAVQDGISLAGSVVICDQYPPGVVVDGNQRVKGGTRARCDHLDADRFARASLEPWYDPKSTRVRA